ncbi:Site-specific recombinase%2C DNA invertase Pin-like protein [Streptococcus suis]|uniref:Site-specific recombinase, DNA invertase Pin-like protein n=6 Tax=Streptococcus TaxID=1301 RepID=A0A0Z8EL99_STRSU|nr:Site-specific recombinase%2C DNA invertase Pin-like protein [Streptococcus suis]
MAGIRTENKIYEVGIYCRLSKDDGTDNESASIATQKSILTDYVKRQGLIMTQTVEELRYQLEEWLAQGFTSPEDRANYQALKEQYEDETLDYSFSKREIIGQLEVIITTRENDFPDLDEVTKGEYLDLVEQLDNLDKGQADYYRKQLA